MHVNMFYWLAWPIIRTLIKLLAEEVGLFWVCLVILNARLHHWFLAEELLDFIWPMNAPKKCSKCSICILNIFLKFHPFSIYQRTELATCAVLCILCKKHLDFNFYTIFSINTDTTANTCKILLEYQYLILTIDKWYMITHVLFLNDLLK